MTCSVIPQIDSSQFIERVLLRRANALVYVSPDSGLLAAQFLDELAAKLSGQIQFFRIDPEREAGLASTYRVNDFPAVLFFREGALVDKLTGSIRNMAILGTLSKIVNRNQ